MRYTVKSSRHVGQHVPHNAWRQKQLESWPSTHKPHKTDDVFSHPMQRRDARTKKRIACSVQNHPFLGQALREPAEARKQVSLRQELAQQPNDRLRKAVCKRLNAQNRRAVYMRHHPQQLSHVGTSLVLFTAMAVVGRVCTAVQTPSPIANPLLRVDDRTNPNIGYVTFNHIELFSARGPNITDIWQGGVGTCFFLAPLGSIAHATPNWLVESMQHYVEWPTHFKVRFFTHDSFSNRFKNVWIDADPQLPFDAAKGRLRYASAHDTDRNGLGEVWVAMQEKAFAQFRDGFKPFGPKTPSGYEGIHKGFACDAYRALLGTHCQHVWIADHTQSELATQISDAGRMHYLSAATYDRGSAFGLVDYHYYSVLGIRLDPVTGEQWVRLNNPWGHGTPGRDTLPGSGMFELPLVTFRMAFKVMSIATKDMRLV